jgi:hypothetical protein
MNPFTFRLHCGFAAAHFWASVAAALAIVDVMLVQGAEATEWFQALAGHWILFTTLSVAVFAIVAVLDARLGRPTR